MKRFLSLCILPIVAVFCLAPLVALAQDTGDLSARVSELEEQMQGLQHSGGAGAPPAAATNLDVRITTLENTLRDMNGQIERDQYAIAQLTARLDKMSTDLDVRFDQMQKEIDAMKVAAQPPAAPPATKPSDAAALTADKGAKSAGSDSDLTPQQQYDQAFAFLRQAKYADAEDGFKSFLAANPNHAMAANARYWLGETYYVRGKFNDAAMTFAESYQKSPKGSKAPDSLLKLGMSLGALNKKQDACVALKEVGDKYPNASASVRNRTTQEMKKLDCQAN